MNNSDKAFVETLTRSQIFRDYETAFREAVGLALAFTPPETWGLPLHEDANENPFCRAMAKCNKTCAACLQTQESLRLRARDSTATETCAFGLCDSAVPVKIGNRLVGFLRTGQVFTAKPTEADFAKVVATLQEWGVALKADELRDDYFASKIVTAQQYAAILRLLEIFAQHLGTVSNQILVAEETAENPQITRAKDFIAENIADDIGLSECACAAHMSTFYFCKMFRKATGLSFTEYLSRLRTEKAKARLLDSHVRVSEVAFEVGFQSLSQFNRVFKSVTGLSPSEYRRSLPANAVRTGRSAAEPAPSEARPLRFAVTSSPTRSAARAAGVAAR